MPPVAPQLPPLVALTLSLLAVVDAAKLPYWGCVTGSKHDCPIATEATERQQSCDETRKFLQADPCKLLDDAACQATKAVKASYESRCLKADHHWRYHSDGVQSRDLQESYDGEACDETMSGTNDAGYRGCQNQTPSGKTCQQWSAQSPHSHSFSPQNYPNSDLAENYCRNPDGSNTIWCYTTDAATRWEYCGVPLVQLSELEKAVLSDETQEIMVTGFESEVESVTRRYTKSTIQKWTRDGDGGDVVPTYAVTHIKTTSSGEEVCTVKYGYSPVCNEAKDVVKLYVYVKMACSDDHVNYVTRKRIIRGWKIECGGTSTMGSRTHCHACYQAFYAASCTKIGNEQSDDNNSPWVEFELDDAAKAGAAIQ